MDVLPIFDIELLGTNMFCGMIKLGLTAGDLLGIGIKTKCQVSITILRTKISYIVGVPQDGGTSERGEKEHD